ncbi:MAG TPA: Uma2 family endonuclease [Candidatus Elarobacter sp.]|nr:Uma2 family endonuclease [Candidatus Elarobacter sp.]
MRYPDNVDAMSDMELLEFLRRPISVDEYNQMAEVGILARDERVELLDGDVIVVPPHGPPHFSTVLRMGQRLTLGLATRADVSVQLPIIVSERSEPEPDIAILAKREDCYASGLPHPPDVFAIVEVADSSLPVDAGKKLKIYAEAGIPEYWIVDVPRGAVIVHRDPVGSLYDSIRTAYRGASVSFAAFPGETFTVDELIG